LAEVGDHERHAEGEPNLDPGGGAGAAADGHVSLIDQRQYDTDDRGDPERVAQVLAAHADREGDPDTPT
jgi:hypothetical protein